METPEQPHQHPHHTGHSWLDIVLALSAIFMSVISLIVAIEHGRTMQRMADANTRMVEANSWPFLEFRTHNLDEQGKGDIRLTIANQGIGPARIQTMEMWYNGQPIATLLELAKECCQKDLHQHAEWSMSNAAPSILRAGDHSNVFEVPLNEVNKDFWDKLNVERDKISVRMCYCSVFDECWIGSGTTTQADRVPSCPVPKVPFHLTD